MSFFEKLGKKRILIATGGIVVLIIFIVIGIVSCKDGNENDEKINISKEDKTNVESNTSNSMKDTSTDKLISSESSKNEEKNENETTSENETKNEDTTTVVQDTTQNIENETSAVADHIIRLNGNSISYGGTGATINGSEVTITADGEYFVTGTLNDGRIIVNADSDADITINLMGVNISNADSCCIYVISADKVVLNLNEGTNNVINDGASYIYDNETEEEPNAAIFSKDDLVIEGTGTLTVNGNFNNGIASKDDLRILGGTVNVTAVNHGLKGKDALEMSNANVTVDSGGDAFKADNTETGMGGIYIESGTYNLTAKEDGIQAEAEVVINGGTFTIKTGNGSNSSGANSDTSMKGIKATGNVIINGGTFTVNSQDDAIHANANVTVTGGTLNMASADDGMHADTDLTISGGNITITKSYEGIEATNIFINGGTTSVVASDDGLNAAGGNDTGNSNGGNRRPGMGNFSGTSGTITFTSGTLIVDASGDGIDSNGTVSYNGGDVTVYGPTSGGNGTLDYDGSWTQNGGNFVGIGGKDMAQMPSGGSQYSVMITFTMAYQSGSNVVIKDANGNIVLDITAKKNFQNIVFSNSKLANGSYTVYVNGNEYTTFTISNILTTVGSSGGMGGRW